MASSKVHQKTPWSIAVLIPSLIDHLFARESSEDGQTLVEYALIISLVSVALIAALALLSTNIGNLFANIEATL